MKLQDCINLINSALSELGQKKAYDIKHPSYNWNGYCFERIVAGTVALSADVSTTYDWWDHWTTPPEDVPHWDHWLERYVPGEFFWKLWAYKTKQDPEEFLDRRFNSEAIDKFVLIGKGRTVLGQVTALNRVRQSNESTT